MNNRFPTLFSPIQIGTVTVPNRFVVPPMGNNFANTDGSLSDRSAAYYEARAKGGFGLITIESTVVYEQAKGGPRKPCLFSDDVVPSFKAVADRCHAYGAKLSIQLQHAGLLQAAYHHEQPHKEQQGLIVHLAQQLPGVAPVHQQGDPGDDDPDDLLGDVDAVHRQHGYAVLFLQLGRQGLDILPGGARGVISVCTKKEYL